MGHPALDFRSAQDMNRRFSSPEEEEMSELLQFLEKPQSIGLNNVKESLRNTVLLMMAMTGLDTGYRYTPIMGDDYAGLSLDGTAEYQRKKKKKKKQLWDQLLEMERLLAENFKSLFENTLTRIYDVKKEINHQIQVLDRMIETNKDDGFFAEEDLREAKQELKDLKDLKTEIEDLETDLKKTENPIDIVKIEKKLDDKASNIGKPHSVKNNDFFDVLKKSMDKRKADHLAEVAAAAASASASTAHDAEPAPPEAEAPSTDSPDHSEAAPSSPDAATGDSSSAEADAAHSDDHSDTESEAELTDENNNTAPDAAVTSDDNSGSDDDGNGDDGDNDDEDDLEPPSPVI